MLIPIHEEITRAALEPRVSARALEIIVAANRKQDSLRNQIGHDEIHFDNNALAQGNAYIKQQRGFVLTSLMSPGILTAWIAFGRLIHTAQDFYSHTNYVSLWIEQWNGTPPPPAEIDPVQKSLIKNPNLQSGRIYLPFDVFYFIPFLRKLSLALLPRNSHGWMNLDSPAQGRRFEYARAAAIKRTMYEFELIEKLLPPEMLARFIDM